MKFLNVMGVTLISASCLMGAVNAQDISRDDIMMMSHRADWRAFPENSLPAIQSALNKKVEIIEVDIRMTSDGVIVLSHDTTVNRTTNGSGSISSMTYDDILKLRLREYWGGEAAVTDYHMPTLKEALELIDGQAMIFLDKGWALREEAYELIKSMDMLDHVIFDTSAGPDAVAEFGKKDSRIQQLYRINASKAGDIQHFEDLNYVPYTYSLNYNNYLESHIQPETLDRIQSNGTKVMYNTLWYGQTPDATDEVSHFDPDAGWGRLIRHMRADIIQTDNIDEMTYWLENKSLPHLDNNSVIVMADEFGMEGFGESYFDSVATPSNGPTRPADAIEFCDKNGTLLMCNIRNDEWVKYEIVIPQAGYYDVSARVSSRQQNAGSFFLEFDDANIMHHEVMNTSSHGLMMHDSVGEVYLDAGKQEFTFRVDNSAPNNNFNIHYFMFEPRDMSLPTASCEYSISSEWDNGFIANVRIQNLGNETIYGWEVNWNYTDNAKADSVWNASLSGNNPYTAKDVEWNALIRPGQTIEFGIQGKKPMGTAHQIPHFTGGICE
ncbi:hypothetical protein VIN01S_25360 [Vibrio inusitatus NBRC 102082]|uniref:GP-PDE domain-containing protein n=1 Tax=Vibrio inusitatus NBRC 102082 TaxID=1219070 RepID=A0A4Y3HYH3_9VIBR|nr:cellulose binding domain-containing protein [Vibrio inusitatus]GEA51732.1 hypothetical protein VIN01S_25360 [Vibrio inusitatus NBRC 102082]